MADTGSRLVRMECPNCGTDLDVLASETQTSCRACGSNLSVYRADGGIWLEAEGIRVEALRNLVRISQKLSDTDEEIVDVMTSGQVGLEVWIYMAVYALPWVFGGLLILRIIVESILGTLSISPGIWFLGGAVLAVGAMILVLVLPKMRELAELRSIRREYIEEIQSILDQEI